MKFIEIPSKDCEKVCVKILKVKWNLASDTKISNLENSIVSKMNVDIV